MVVGLSCGHQSRMCPLLAKDGLRQILENGIICVGILIQMSMYLVLPKDCKNLEADMCINASEVPTILKADMPDHKFSLC